MHKKTTMKITQVFLLAFTLATTFATNSAFAWAQLPTTESAAIVAPETGSAELAAKGAKLPNLAVVTAGIYRGGRPQDEQGFQQLKDMGIKTVIDLQGGDIGNSDFGWVAGILEPGEHASWLKYERESLEALGIKFINVPINSLDQMNQKSGAGLGRALALAADPANQPVYIHCEHGIDRTGLAVALYRVYFQQWKRQVAYDEMVNMGHGFFRRIFTGSMSDFFWAATEGLP